MKSILETRADMRSSGGRELEVLEDLREEAWKHSYIVKGRGCYGQRRRHGQTDDYPIGNQHCHAKCLARC